MSENDHDYDYDEPEVTARGCLLAVPIAIALWVGIFFALRAFFFLTGWRRGRIMDVVSKPKPSL